MMKKYLFVFISILTISIVFYSYYKTRILKKAVINDKYYLEYNDVDLFTYFLMENFEDTSIVDHRSDVIDVAGIFVDNNFIFLYNENQQYYAVDKEKLEIKQLNSNDMVLVNNKLCQVDKINFEAPFWFLVLK